MKSTSVTGRLLLGVGVHVDYLRFALCMSGSGEVEL